MSKVFGCRVVTLYRMHRVELIVKSIKDVEGQHDIQSVNSSQARIAIHGGTYFATTFIDLSIKTLSIKDLTIQNRNHQCCLDGCDIGDVLPLSVTLFDVKLMACLFKWSSLDGVHCRDM